MVLINNDESHFIKIKLYMKLGNKESGDGLLNFLFPGIIHKFDVPFSVIFSEERVG